jgi:hypothetical protein
MENIARNALIVFAQFATLECSLTVISLVVEILFATLITVKFVTDLNSVLFVWQDIDLAIQQRNASQQAAVSRDVPTALLLLAEIVWKDTLKSMTIIVKQYVYLIVIIAAHLTTVMLAKFILLSILQQKYVNSIATAHSGDTAPNANLKRFVISVKMDFPRL